MNVTTYQRRENAYLDELSRLYAQRRLVRFYGAILRREHPESAEIINSLLLLLETAPQEEPIVTN